MNSCQLQNHTAFALLCVGKNGHLVSCLSPHVTRFWGKVSTVQYNQEETEEEPELNDELDRFHARFLSPEERVEVNLHP